MENKSQELPRTRIHRIREQGYLNFSNTEISSLAFGNRFAYIVCSILVGIGVATASVPLLSFMALIAFGGIVLPYHPFDYIYNYLLRKPMNKPKLPPRSRQLKFACTLATVWLAGTVLLFHNGLATAGYIVGSLLFLVAFTVSAFDLCIPSIIYNFLFKVKVEKT